MSAGADRQHPPLGDQWPQFRMLFGRPGADRQPRRRLYRRAAGAGRRRHHQAFRRQRKRNRAHHRQLGHRRAHAARGLPAALRGGGEARRHLGDHVVLQQAQRHLCRREPLAADQGPARGLGLRRHRHVRLVRLAHHRADHQCRPRPRNARSDPRPRREAGRRRRGRARSSPTRCAPAPCSMLRLFERTGALDDRRTAAGTRRRPARAPRPDPPRRRRGDGAAQERRHPAARSQALGQDRGHRPKRQGGPDHGRRLGPAQPALPRQPLGRAWPPRSARTRRPTPTAAANHRFEPLVKGAFRAEFFANTRLSPANRSCVDEP